MPESALENLTVFFFRLGLNVKRLEFLLTCKSPTCKQISGLFKCSRVMSHVSSALSLLELSAVVRGPRDLPNIDRPTSK